MSLRNLLLTASVSAALIGFSAGDAAAGPRGHGREPHQGSAGSQAAAAPESRPADAAPRAQAVERVAPRGDSRPAPVERRDSSGSREQVAPGDPTTRGSQAVDRAERRWPGSLRDNRRDDGDGARVRGGQAVPRTETPSGTFDQRRRTETTPMLADEQRGGRGQSRPRSGPSVGRAVPRVGPAPQGGHVYSPRDGRVYRGGVVVSPRMYYYPRRYYPYGYGGFGLGFYYYDPYAWYPYSYPYYYGRPSYGGGYYDDRYYEGELRLEVRPRDAEVYVDGYYVGRVDDFDGVFQAMRLTDGPHRVEIVAPGFETLAFDVRIEPGRKINYRGDLRPAPPGYQPPPPYQQQPPPYQQQPYRP